MRGSKQALRPMIPKFRRIVRRPDTWGGKAVVAGTRIPVFLLAAKLKSGWTEADLLDDYPSLTAEDVQAVVRYIRCFSARVIADRGAYERSLPT